MIESKIQVITDYVDKWLQFQALWDLEAEHVYQVSVFQIPHTSAYGSGWVTHCQIGHNSCLIFARLDLPLTLRTLEKTLQSALLTTPMPKVK